MAAVEIFTNNGTTTVTSGGTDAPVSGTSQTWTVTSSATFPAAATGVTQFHVGDPAAASELITVTNVSGTTWTVTRGAEGTTPVAHAAGFTVDEVITAGALGALAYNPMTALGDLAYGGTVPSAGTPARLAGGTTSTKQFLVQTGTGSVSAAPAWGTIASADMPAGTTSAQGALQLDGTASNVKAPAIAAAAGTGTLAAISTHVHPLQDPLALGVAQTLLPVMSQSANTVGGGSTAWYQRLMSGGYTISHIVVGVQTSSGSICLAAYQASGAGATAVPGTQYATSGGVACPSTGNATVALGGSCTPNLTDWLAITADNGTATFYSAGGNANAIAAAFTYTQTVFPLPGTASSLTSNNARIFALRGS